MQYIIYLVFTIAFILRAGQDNVPDEIIACGDDQVIVIDYNASVSENVSILWRWKVSEAKYLPAPYQKYMRPTDDCKPVDGKSKILITSSGGGVALVERKSGKSLFYARSPMAHSAEPLPGGRVVVALSTAEGGNRIELYDFKYPEKVLFSDSLYSGHGVVWLEKSKSLYALGYNELRRYSLNNWNSEKPSLRQEESWSLPDNGGHELSPVSETGLILSTSNSVWLFNTENGSFTPFELLKNVKNVKSVNYNKSSGMLIFTKGEISWWTHNIYSKNPEKVIQIPDLNIYKVRVIPDR